MKFYDIEHDMYITLEELKTGYEELVNNAEFDGTFNEYIAECTGKNGTLIKA